MFLQGIDFMFRPFWFIVTAMAMLLSASVIVQGVATLTGSRTSMLPVAGAAVVIAALLEGQNYARTRKAWPGRQLIWLAALSMTAITALIVDAFYALSLLLETGHADGLREIEPLVFGLSIVILAGVSCIVLRFSYEAGLKLVLDRPAR